MPGFSICSVLRCFPLGYSPLMSSPTITPKVARFGPYEVDVRSGELRKFGTRIKLGEQPLRILILLMERQGELVTREELRSQLWSNNTFVDFDHGLNSAVQRLRDGLSDTAQKEQWIETLPRRGYRFVGTVEWGNPNNSPSPPAIAPPSQVEAIAAPAPPVAPRSPTLTRPRWRFILVASPLAILAALLLMMKLGLGPRASTSAASIRSIAVLPLENLSGDSSQEYFADGMTDELITALAKNRSLRVISRTSTMQYKGVRRPLREIARELGVDGILEGSIAHSAGRVHMTVQLIQAATDTHVWAESYDRDLKDASALPLELSQTVAKQVQIAAADSTPHSAINPEAHDAYLHGRYFWFSEKDDSLPYFEKAVRLQPDYAAAWSGVSDDYALRAVSGMEPPEGLRATWEADARKAVELDGSLADAHNSLAGWYLFGAWDWKSAAAESQRALAANPNYAEAYHLYSYILTVANHPNEAVEIQKRGMELDPFARPWALGFTYYHFRRFDAAISELRLRKQAAASDMATREVLAGALRLAGLDKEAVDEWQQIYRLQGDSEGLAGIQQAFAKGGLHDAAEWRLRHRKSLSHGKYLSPFWLALMSAQAQHREETLQLLENAYRERSPRLVFLQNEPDFDFLHADPRYQAIAHKMGLPGLPQ